MKLNSLEAIFRLSFIWLSGLVLSLMIEKFNKKYGDKLSARQRDLLTSKLVLDESRVVDCVKTIKKEARDSVLSFYKDCDNAFLNAKKSTILERIDNLKVSFFYSQILKDR